MDWINTRVDTLGDVEDLTILESMAPDVESFRAMFDESESMGTVRLGPTIGTHGGPRALGVSLVLPRSPTEQLPARAFAASHGAR